MITAVMLCSSASMRQQDTWITLGERVGHFLTCVFHSAQGSMAKRISANEVIRRAMAFDLDPVRSLYREYHPCTASHAKLVERELKRYLSLRALEPDVEYGMAGEPDDFWHVFLQFTRQYAAFCQRIAGRFLHHLPGQGEHTPKGVNTFKVTYASFWRDYLVVFGEHPPETIWPMLDDIHMPQRSAKHRARRQ